MGRSGLLSGMPVQKESCSPRSPTRTGRRADRLRRPLCHRVAEELEDRADLLVLDEGEITMPVLLADLGRGRQERRLHLQRRETRRHAHAGPALRPAGPRRLHGDGRPVFPRLPVPLRVLRHHRALRPDARAPRRRSRSWPSWSGCTSSAGGAACSSSTTTSSATRSQADAAGDASLDAGARLPVHFSTEASMDLAETRN